MANSTFFASLGSVMVIVSWAPSTAAQSSQLQGLYNQLDSLKRQGRFNEAIPVAERFVRLAKREEGQNSQNYALGLFWLAELYGQQGRWADAEHLEGQRPKALLPKLVCERPITPEEAEQYFMEGKTELLAGFISRRGKPFRARLILKANGRHGFEFEPRKPRSPRTAKK